MAKYVLTDAYIAINGTNLSDHCSSISVDDHAAEVDLTTFGPSGYTQIAPGLKDCTITPTWFQDFAASSVHSILQPLYSSGGTFSVEIRPTSAAVSVTNQKATMTGRLFSYAGIGGKVGDAATMDTPIRNAGTAGLVWGTS